ncbi:MAG: maleylpyruvate isomerase family mycothiol-dependent enzyme [Candidatus Dormibacteraeota bacterium]|nr:maleylpyruvate isomerase family mycothiol-dependent enzyme [Candidatus Dormibacteraeota bacterium]MBV9526062.1 maleylpyruvate isomerase family mycothiol-dependent enzyme [Candidatus Dormibacteraeota bacterium]
MPDTLLRSADGFRTAYRETLGHIETLVAPLQGDEWDRETGCPGWSVRDVVAHVSALESLLIGREAPEHRIPKGLAHVLSPMGEWTESGVDYRRAWPPADLLREYREVTAIRLERLDRVTDADMESEATGLFFGPTTLARQLTIRIFDLWCHEQDLRRALGRPGDFDSLAGLHSQEMLVRGMGRRTAERLSPPDGTTVLLDITGPGASRRLIAFAERRPRVTDPANGAATTTMRLDMNTLTVLGCGRADDPLARERVTLEGDITLGRRILEDVASTP